MLPSARAFALEYLTVQRAFVSFCAAFAGLSGQISCAVLPALMAAFSPSELRWRGAAMRLASMICPARGDEPRLVDGPVQLLEQRIKCVGLDQRLAEIP